MAILADEAITVLYTTIRISDVINAAKKEEEACAAHHPSARNRRDAPRSCSAFVTWYPPTQIRCIDNCSKSSAWFPRSRVVWYR